MTATQLQIGQVIAIQSGRMTCHYTIERFCLGRAYHGRAYDRQPCIYGRDEQGWSRLILVSEAQPSGIPVNA